MKPAVIILVSIALLTTLADRASADPTSKETSLALATAGISPMAASEAAPSMANADADERVSKAVRSNTTVFGLPRNIGDGERVFRAVVAATLIGVGSYGLATDEIGSGLSIGLLAVSSIPTLTSATGYCPLYHALGKDTRFLDF